jgi:hypothetical protein
MGAVIPEPLRSLALQPKADASPQRTRLCAQHHIPELDALHRHQRGAAVA